MSEDLSALEHFNGLARLFPLPNLVLFPQLVQPLHIFEPRYRQMTADALAADRLLALVLLQPGWEADYEGRPALHSVACLGTILAEERLEEGRFNLLLRGLARVRLREEISSPKLYRSARVEILTDVVVASAQREQALRQQLLAPLPHWFPQKPELVEEFRTRLKADLALGMLCDILTFALPLDFAFKQALLEELDVEQRACRLLERLEMKAPDSATPERLFPPDFSSN